jgi:peptidyl-prolyl cis-trans isomerase A (cyclophilin A)
MVFFALFLSGRPRATLVFPSVFDAISMKKLLSPALLVATAVLSANAANAQTVVCVETNLDTFCMELLQSQAPLATANFLRYVDDGDYTNTLIHQSERGGYLVGGMWQASLDPLAVAADAPVAYQTSIANTRGTVALVTTPGQPNSATSGFRINVADNSARFTPSNSGTVFARVLGDGLTVADRLSKLTVHSLNSSHLSQAPLLQLDNKITADDLVQIKRVYRYAGTLADFNNYGINFPPKEVIPPQIEEVACLQTSLGELCMRLYKDDAPNTVSNFTKYITDGDYNGSIFHRSVPGFVVQGGGFRFTTSTITEVPADPAVANEYKRPNTFGTIAMAKLGDQPNSATNQWFINTADNTDVLGSTNNGGFTVFGEVIPSDIPVLTDITSIRPYDLSPTYGSAFGEVPLLNPDADRSLDDFINVDSAYLAQRDVAAQPEADTTPLRNIVALATYGVQFTGSGIRIPVRFGSKFYQLVLNRNTDDTSLFSVDLIRIVELKDTGRISATLAGDVLMIPTVRVGDKVYANVTMRMTDSRTLTFRLESLEQLP